MDDVNQGDDNSSGTINKSNTSSVAINNCIKQMKYTQHNTTYLIVALLVFHCVAFLKYSFAAPLPDQILFHNLNINDGLVDNNVVALVQDRDGFMWFGTENGLNRYDGYDFTLFSPSLAAPSRDIGKLSIRSLCAGNEDTIWIGSEYLLRYDHEINRIKKYDITANMGVRVIKTDNDGNIWMGGERFGLRKFDPESETLKGTYYQNNPAAPLVSDSINDLYFSPNGNIWVATDQGLFLFNQQTEKLISPFKHPILNRAKITSLTEDTENRLWIGTWEGLFSYHLLTGSFKSYNSTPGSERPILHKQIHSLLCDSLGNVWVGTDKQGLGVYEKKTQKIRLYQAGVNNPYLLGGGAVFDIFEDQDHGIWVAVQGFGTYRFNTSHQLFKFYPPNPHNPTMLNHPVVLSIEEGLEDDIWIATDGGGLNRLHNATSSAKQVITRLQHDPADSNSLSSDSVIGLAQEKNDGDLWIGTWAGGLNKYSPTSGTFTHFRHKTSPLLPDSELQSTHATQALEVPQKLASDNVFSLYIDSRKQLWISVWGVGLQILDLDTEKITRTLVGNPAGTPDTMLNCNVMAILEDKDGIMWFGGYNGLDRYDPNTNSFKNYNTNDPLGSPISDNTIFALHQSKTGQLWIATNNGLNVFEPATESFANYTVTDGLANNSIVGILEDKAGILWLSTKHGLSQFNPKTREITNYHADEGLQSNEFSRFSYERLQTGELAFGGVNGFNIFNPAIANFSRPPPRVILTQLLLFNQPVAINDRQKHLSKAVNRVSEIALNPDDDTVSLIFSAMEYETPSSINYRFRLDGVDHGWLTTGSDKRIATYTQLAPGKYTFHVQAKFSNSDWGEEKQVTLAVAPYWWETIPFYFISVVAAVFVIYLIYLSRISRVKAKLEAEQRKKETAFFREKTRQLATMNNELENLAREKEDLLHLVAHDLRNPLTGIQLNIKMLSYDSFDLDPSTQKETYRQINKMISRMIETINASLTDPSHSALGDHAKNTEIIAVNPNIREVIKEHTLIAERKSIRLSFSSTLADTLSVAGYTFAFHQILDNLLSNSIKFSYPKSEVHILCKMAGSEVEISVSDQGPGIAQEDQHKIFNKRVQLSAQPTGGETSNGIGLYNAQNTAKSMGGYITFHSDGQGRGATFSLFLPINKKDYEYTIAKFQPKGQRQLPLKGHL